MSRVATVIFSAVLAAVPITILVQATEADDHGRQRVPDHVIDEVHGSKAKGFRVTYGSGDTFRYPSLETALAECYDAIEDEGPDAVRDCTIAQHIHYEWMADMRRTLNHKHVNH